MTKQREPQQTVATAEAILRDLETKRDECLQHGQELTNVRRAHAYQAPCTTRRELADVAAFQQDEGRYQRPMPWS